MAVSARAYVQLVRTNPNFRRIWLAQIVSEMGDWFYVVAIYALLLQLTGTAKSVAVALVLQVLPQLFVSPLAGIVNDRFSRRRVMISADLARAVIVLAMIGAVHSASVPLIYTLLFLETVMWAFFEPGRSAIMPNVTSPAELTAANALSSMTWSFNLAVGSGIGGAVAAFLGQDAVFVLDALSFLVSAALVRRVSVVEKHLERQAPFHYRDIVRPITEAIAYVRRDRRLLALLSVKAGVGLFGAQWVLLPIYGERIFPLSDMGAGRAAMLPMSILMASRGVGALLGPWFGGIWAGDFRTRLRSGILFGFLAGSAGFLMLAWAPALWAGALAMMLANSGISLVWVFSTTLLQFQTEDRFRGRVFSADFSFLVVSMSVVSYGAGVLIDSGTPARIVALGVALAGLAPVTWWAFMMRRWELRPRRGGSRDDAENAF